MFIIVIVSYPYYIFFKNRQTGEMIKCPSKKWCNMLCVCVCVAGHQSVYLAQIIRWWGFQPQAVDIPDLGYVYPPSTLSIPTTSKIRSSDKTRQTKDRQWAHGRPPLWESVWPNNLGTIYSDFYLSQIRYERQLQETNDTNYNIQGQGRKIGGAWESSNQ